MPAVPEVTVTNATGATIAIVSDPYRKEVLLRCRGARVWIGFNEPAILNQGIWVNNGDGVVIAQPLCMADMYFVCATTAYIGAETVYG